MNRHKLAIALISFLFSFHIFNLAKVSAAEHKLENLHIHVFINHDGSATITEQRKANLSEGTENYLMIGNLGKSKIKDFIVKEDGQTYQYVEKWDIDASRSEKTFKNGMIEKKDGYELSWGIGEYGQHEYIVEYTVTHFIKQLQDSQILFWRFVNDQTNIPPKEVTVVIETDHQLSESTEKIWAFGYEGTIQFNNGKVIAKNNEPLDRNNYVTVLVKFADGMFQTDDYIDQSFEDIKEEAFVGSDYGKEGDSKDGMSPFLKYTLTILAIFGFILFARKKPIRMVSRKRPKKFRRKYRNEYYRDDPYDGDFTDIYYLLYMMGASNFKKLLTSFILKWINEGRISVETEPSGFIFKKNVAVIYFLDKKLETDTPEGELFHMMLVAAGFTDRLKAKEFSNWAEENYKKLIAWEKILVKQSIKKLQDLDYLNVQEKGKFIFKKKDYVLTVEGQELEEKIYKYVNYLHDFSLLNEHEAVNVKIWDQIMIFAALLGLTDVVTKQFNKLYPTYQQETQYTGNTVRSTNSFSSNVSNARTSGSSGSGGSSSSGGGGGSFGGGSGGGTR